MLNKISLDPNSFGCPAGLFLLHKTSSTYAIEYQTQQKTIEYDKGRNINRSLGDGDGFIVLIKTKGNRDGFSHKAVPQFYIAKSPWFGSDCALCKSNVN